MLGEIDTVSPYSPLRWWLYNEMKIAFPPGVAEITSNGKFTRETFTKWTGWTHEGLVAQWAKEKGTGKVTTSCNAFLNIVSTKICLAGGMAPKTLHSFQLMREPGWHYYPDKDLTPQAGDFFEYGTPTYYDHVGLIFDMVGANWTTIEAGQGGPKKGFDAIDRKGPRPFPDGPLLGWLNIEEYFDGWKDPGTYQ